MAGKKRENITGVLASQLARVEEYGLLLEEQEKLIEQGDNEDLVRVLESKEEILAGLKQAGSLSRLAELASGERGKNSTETQKLLELLISRLKIISGREKESIHRASGVRKEIEGQLHMLAKGKNLLKKYTPRHGETKARFKDITT